MPQKKTDVEDKILIGARRPLSEFSIISAPLGLCFAVVSQMGNAPEGFTPLHHPQLLQIPSLGRNSCVS